jgi:hypothetical protein
MSTNAVIDVGLALVLMYLVLSLFCTIINEYISDWTSMRARTLSRGLSEIIDDQSVLAAFRNHGLINAVCRVAGGPPSYLAAKTFAQALVESLDPAKPIVGVADVRAAAEKLPDTNIRDVVLSAIGDANNDLTTLRDNISHWYDDAMDRLSGTYKRYAHTLSLIVGLLLAAALNADTFAVAGNLWKDGTVRAEIVQAASQSVSQGNAADQGEPLSRLSALEKAEDKLRPFPIGWTPTSLAWKSDFRPNAQIILFKILGIVLTGLALSLGAPFWFDLLSKFVNVRAAGVKPERTSASD